MKTIEVNIYEFSELSEETKQKAINNLHDINVDYDWWQFMYDDAENVFLKITGFDIDRGSYCNLELLSTHSETADKILSEHGEQCDTYKLAKEFNEARDMLVAQYSNGVKFDTVAEENEAEFDEDCDNLEEQFLKDLSEEYLKLLRQEYEYRMSEDAIKETIEANEYEFTEDGKIY